MPGWPTCWAPHRAGQPGNEESGSSSRSPYGKGPLKLSEAGWRPTRRLTLADFTGQPIAQLALLEDARRDRLQRLVEADRRLRPLMGGRHALYRIAGVAPWHPVPEMRFLQTPIDPSGQDAIRPLLTPKPVDVREDAAGEPQSVCAGRHWREVARIDDRWTIDLWWLPKPITRSYYRVDPGDGKLITLFRDCVDRRWYRQSA